MGDISSKDAAPFRKLAGADETAIGNIGDRLKINSSVSPIPAVNVIYKDTRLKNGSSKKLDVDGSSAPVDFDFVPGAGETWYLEALSIFIIDPGSADYKDFGAITGGLSTGLELLIRTNGTEYVETNLKDNADIVQCFGGGSLVSEGNEGMGFIDEDDVYFGTMKFNVPIKIDSATSDYVRARVNDDLTKLTSLQLSLHAWRVV